MEIWLTGNDLGGGVIGRAATRLHEFAVQHHIGESEVGDLDVQVLIQQQVLWFQVSERWRGETQGKQITAHTLFIVPSLSQRPPNTELRAHKHAHNHTEKDAFSNITEINTHIRTVSHTDRYI